MSHQLVSLETLAHKINEQQALIEEAWGVTLERAREAGELLIEAKRLVGHGNWLPWLEANCRVSASMAGKYMKIARGWNVLVQGNTERVPYLSIRDALKLLAKPRQTTEPVPPTIDAEYTEVVESGSAEVDLPEPDSVADLLARLEQVFLAVPVKGRAKAVDGVIERLYEFMDHHCTAQTTLVKLRESFPGVPARILRKEVADFISQWEYAQIRRDDKGREFIKTEWAEDFIRLQRERGWKPGSDLVPGYFLNVSPTPLIKPNLP